MYYNFKLSPNGQTSSPLDSVTFNSLVTNDSNCQTTEANGVKTITCNSTGDGYDGATYKLKFNVETVQYDKYRDAWNTSVEIIGGNRVLGTSYLVENANSIETEYSNETKSEMFTFTHGEGNDAVTDLRYIGDSPNNYVKFNCDNDGTNCEIWRIIGVFNVERPNPENSEQTITEQRIKLVRGYLFDNPMAWNEWYNV